MINIGVITYNRIAMLKLCLASIIETTRDIEKVIYVWDNFSSDGSREYLKRMSYQFEFIKPVLSGENIGNNAKGKVIDMMNSDFRICLDDDIIQFPENWVRKMINAFKVEPLLGYLALDVIQNEYTDGAKPVDAIYKDVVYDDGTVIQYGPTGGWCFMIPAEVYKKVGKLRQMKNYVFFGEDGDYTMRCKAQGFKYGILKDVKCFHATGPYYNKEYKDIYDKKMKDWEKSKTVIDFHIFKRKFVKIYHKLRNKLYDN
ncbi:MAG: glycosyltransferase [Ignavibacteria bacterium]|nr:glycosyltransferase [Ignavibacteria bacterium]